MTSYKPKIDVVAVPFSGHLYPLIELMTPLLQSDKYEIRFFTGVQKVALLEDLGFTVIPLFPDQPTIMEEIANTDSQVKSNGLAMYKQLKQNLALLPSLVDLLKTAFQEHGTELVVADFISVPAGLACRELGIPWLTTIPTPFAIETPRGTPSYLGGWQEHPDFLYQVRDYIGRKVVRGFKRAMAFAVRRPLAELDFQLYDSQGEERLYSPYSILGLGMTELEFNRQYPSQFQMIGPCCHSPETGLGSGFSGKDKCVFVSIGTHLEWGKGQLIPMLRALADANPDYDFVFSKGHSQQIIAPPQKLRPNLEVYSYLPYSEVLPQCDYVIHHGGAGIFYNCVKYAKPALITPHDYDQFDYGARAIKYDVGIQVKKLSSNQLLRGFKELIGRDWQHLTAFSTAFAQYHPGKRFEEEVQRLLKEGAQ